MEDFLGRDHCIDRLCGAGRDGLDNVHLVLKLGVVHEDIEEKTVLLRFRQRVRPLLIDRVLRGDDEERAFQLIDLTADRNLLFLHRFEQSRLRFWRGTIDLVG